MSDPGAIAANLTEWWMKTAHREITPVAAKAAEYGSNSLEQLGHHIARLQGRTVSAVEALELGCWINVVQKVERMTDAVLRGEVPGGDSINDAKVYLTMIQRIRATGSWPGLVETSE